MPKQSITERAEYLVNTSIEDMRSSLAYVRSLPVLEEALTIVTGRHEKTMAMLIGRKIRKIKKSQVKTVTA